MYTYNLHIKESLKLQEIPAWSSVPKICVQELLLVGKCLSHTHSTIENCRRQRLASLSLQTLLVYLWNMQPINLRILCVCVCYLILANSLKRSIEGWTFFLCAGKIVMISPICNDASSYLNNHEDEAKNERQDKLVPSLQYTGSVFTDRSYQLRFTHGETSEQCRDQDARFSFFFVHCTRAIGLLRQCKHFVKRAIAFLKLYDWTYRHSFMWQALNGAYSSLLLHHVSRPEESLQCQ